LERLLRRRELRAQLAQARRQALRERAAVRSAAAEAPAAAAEAVLAVAAVRAPSAFRAQLVEAGLHRLELRSGRTRDVAVEAKRLAARPELRDDLRDDPVLVLRDQREPRRHLRDIRELRDLTRGRLLERKLRARQ